MPPPAPKCRARRRPSSVDLARRQITVEVPHSEWNPGASTVRLAAGVGLWNALDEQLPAAGRGRQRDAARRRGADTTPPAFFDVAFRFNAQEPVPGTPGAATTTAIPPGGGSPRRPRRSRAATSAPSTPKSTSPSWRRRPTTTCRPADRRAAERRLRPHPRLALLRRAGRRLRDRRLRQLGGVHRRDARPAAAVRDLRARAAPQPSGGWGATLLLHSLSANYNQFAGSKNQSQFAARGAGSIVFTPSGRGPDGWYYDRAGRGHVRSVG